MEIMGQFTNGTCTGVEAQCSLPSGYTSSSSLGAGTNVCGNFGGSGTGAVSQVLLVEPSVTYLTFGFQSVGLASLSKLLGTDISTGVRTAVRGLVPIQGWGSNVVMSQDASSRVVSMRALTPAGTFTINNPIIFGTAGFDTHAAYSTATGIYTVPVSGIYAIRGWIDTGSAGRSIAAAVNGSAASTAGITNSSGVLTFTTSVSVKAGDQISIVDTGGSQTTTVGTLCIDRLSGPDAIAASESVNALYESNTARSISNNAATTGQFLMEDLIFDSHGAYNPATAIYTCPASGVYRATAMIELASNAGWNTLELLEIQLFKNGSLNRTMGGLVAQATATLVMETQGATLVSCLAGDTLEVRILQNSGGAISTSGTQQKNWVSYERVGN
jgi:hypothetical protein